MTTLKQKLIIIKLLQDDRFLDIVEVEQSPIDLKALHDQIIEHKNNYPNTSPADILRQFDKELNSLRTWIDARVPLTIILSDETSKGMQLLSEISITEADKAVVNYICYCLFVRRLASLLFYKIYNLKTLKTTYGSFKAIGGSLWIDFTNSEIGCSPEEADIGFSRLTFEFTADTNYKNLVTTSPSTVYMFLCPAKFKKIPEATLTSDISFLDWPVNIVTNHEATRVRVSHAKDMHTLNLATVKQILENVVLL